MREFPESPTGGWPDLRPDLLSVVRTAFVGSVTNAHRAGNARVGRQRQDIFSGTSLLLPDPALEESAEAGTNGTRIGIQKMRCPWESSLQTCPACLRLPAHPPRLAQRQNQWLHELSPAVICPSKS